MSAVNLSDADLEYLAGAALRDGKQALADHLLFNRMTERIRPAVRPAGKTDAPVTRSGLPKPPTSTVGGRRDQTAIVGHAPEHRDWKPGDPAYHPVVDPEARLEAYVTIDAGMERPTFIGKAWLLKHSHVGHDAIIEDGCELSPGVVICGHAQLGIGVKVGVNACVLPYVKVGAGARIGAGAVVTKDVPAGQVWAGNPARRLPPKFRVVS